MRLTRCYVDQPLQGGSIVTLPPPVAAHLTRVLRLRAGASVTLFDGRGAQYPAQLLAGDGKALQAAIGASGPIEPEPALALCLLQCLARGERMDWIVQKATELGVTSIAPVASAHSVVQLDTASGERRVAHWRSVAVGACEQSGRNRLPLVQPVRELAAACHETAQHPAGAHERRLLLWPQAEQSLPAALAAACGRPPVLRELSLLVGPEGGLSQSEYDEARRCGFQPVRLGRRILRAETAPLAALAAIQALVGDFI